MLWREGFLYVRTRTNSQTKDQRRMGKLEKGSIVMVRNVEEVGCVSQVIDSLSQRSVRSILKKGRRSSRSDLRQRHTQVAERLFDQTRKGMSIAGSFSALGSSRALFLCSGNEDRSQEETDKQQRWAHREAWDLAKQVCNIIGSLGQNKATLFSPLFDRCLPEPSTINPEETEFVDSGSLLAQVAIWLTWLSCCFTSTTALRLFSHLFLAVVSWILCAFRNRSLSKHLFSPITVPDITPDAQTSTISNTGFHCSNNSDLNMCRPVGLAAGNCLGGTSVPAGSNASLEAILLEMSRDITNSISNMQKQISDFFPVTSAITK